MSTNNDRRFGKYKPVKVNGVFVPELASYPVTVPPLVPPERRTNQTTLISVSSGTFLAQT